MASALGDRLRALRERAGISARHLDKLAGITPNHTSQIETGTIEKPNVRTIVALAGVLGAGLDFLVMGAGRAPDEKTLRAAVARAERAAARTGTEG